MIYPAVLDSVISLAQNSSRYICIYVDVTVVAT